MSRLRDRSASSPATTPAAIPNNLLSAVVADDDIDPTDLFEVLWAMCTRCDPAEDIEILRKMWSGPLDPRIPRGTTWNSRAVIDACRPFEMLKDFPPVARASRELRQEVEAKFRDVLSKP